MSEPKRYSVRGFSAALVEENNGVYVRYEDYARLKAEVERLTKAGDAMVGLLEHLDVIVDMDSDHPEVEAWYAAKKGGQP